MSESKLKWAWEHRQGIGAFAIVAGLSMLVAPHMGGGENEPNAARRTQGGNHAADFTNRNPAGALACKLVLTPEGDQSSDPYKLKAYITSGTPPKGAQLKYQAKYQGGMNDGFDNFREDPVTVGWQEQPTIAGEAFSPDGGDEPIPLGSVSGKVAGAACAPAFAHGD